MSTADTTTEAFANTLNVRLLAKAAKAFDGMRPI